jgi:hypothetical protein
MDTTFKTAISTILLSICGCAPAVLMERPADLPAECQGRQFYHTPQAYIYASSPAAAGEIDRLILSVASQFPAENAAPAQKGLVIVTDVGDDPPFDLDTILTLAMQDAQKGTEIQPATQAAKALTEGRKELEKKGINMSSLVDTAAFPITAELAAPRLAVEEATLRKMPWMLSMPTYGRVSRGCSALLRQMMSSPEISVGQKLLIAPMLVTLEPKMAEMAAVQRETVVFKVLADMRSDWSSEQRKAAAKAFSEARLRPFQLGLKNAVRQATRPAAGATQPSTAPAPTSDPASGPAS